MKNVVRINATQVRDGDIVFCEGYRCRASEVTTENGVARYTLTSAANAEYPRVLPTGFNGGRYGGNRFAVVVIEERETVEG